MFYICQHERWPEFTWDANSLSGLFGQVSFAQGRLLGNMDQLGLRERKESSALVLAQETAKSSEIEGVSLNMEQIRSSVCNRLALHVPAPKTQDVRAAGATEVLLDATQNFEKPLTKTRLFSWHSALFPGGFSGIEKIRVGAFRQDNHGRMQVVSSRGGRETVHFEAPPAEDVPEEMTRFLARFAKPGGNTLADAAIAHIYFLTIHPFEDGNGRLARAVTEMMLARSENSSLRFYSMSSAIQKNKRSYYDILEKTQTQNSLDITPWTEWFLKTLLSAITDAETTMRNVLAKAEFWRDNNARVTDPNQRKILNRLFDGFEGNLTSSKWAKICKCSQDTATRAIRDLIEKKILQQAGAGRSTHYVLRERQAKHNS